MKRRGWLIFGALLLLWIAPSVYVLTKDLTLKKNVDYTEDWKRYTAQVRYQTEIQQTLAQMRRAKYSGGSSDEPESGGGETEVVYVDRPVVTERVIERPSYQSQPDLTGVYWQRNFGTFQYVLGPL